MPVDLRGVRARGEALRLFVRQPSPRILVAALSALVAARGVQRRPGPGDLRAVAAVAAVRPFAEWVIHREILHAPVRHVAGRTIDTAADHLRHHADPTDLGPVLLAPRYAAAYAAAVAGLCGGASLALFGRRREATTAAAAAVAALVFYEHTHYLIHTNVPARSAWLRRRRRHHRAHHYRDATRDFGITSSVADHVLRTA